MFKKLVGNLPFNPSLISHLRDYDLRLKKEFKLRLAGIVIMLLVLIIQLLVIFLVPNSNTYSPNSLLNNSHNSLSQLFIDCNNNLENYKNVLNFYGLSCSDLYSGKTISLALNSKNADLFSLNRLSYDSQNETTINISRQTFYIRQLVFGNKYSLKNIATREVDLNSRVFYIALGSGNVISTRQTLINNFVQQKCSQNQPVSCFNYSLAARVINSSNTDANNTTQSSGRTIIYTLSATNKSIYKISQFNIAINLQNALAYSDVANTYGGIIKTNVVYYKLDSTLPSQTQTEIITVKIKTPVPDNSMSVTDPNYYAQKMIVSFGNTVVIYIPKSFNKFLEMNINNYLPSSSSEVSLIIVILILLSLIYLLVRNIILREELKIIRHSHSNHQEVKK